jgi:hypothetical protein
MSKQDANLLRNIRQQELGLYGFDPRVGSSYGKLGKQIGGGIKKAYKRL